MLLLSAPREVPLEVVCLLVSIIVGEEPASGEGVGLGFVRRNIFACMAPRRTEGFLERMCSLKLCHLKFTSTALKPHFGLVRT